MKKLLCLLPLLTFISFARAALPTFESFDQTQFTTNGLRIRIRTNNPAPPLITINPTDGFFPYRLNGTTFSNSPLQRVTSTTVGLNGSTNILTTSGAALVYTNVEPKIIVQSPGGTAFMDVDGTGQVAHYEGGSLTAWFANGNQRGVIAFDTELAPSSSLISLGSGNNPWKGISLSDDINWNGTTNSLHDSWGNGSPEGAKNGFPGSIYRDAANGDIYKKSTGTGNTGWTLIGSGGSALWASAGGVLVPSPAINVVNITSQLADHSTNRVLILDTLVPWTNGVAPLFVTDVEFPFQVRNAGTNYFQVDAFGGLNLGANWSWWGSSASADGISLVSIHDVVYGEGNANGVVFYSIDSGNPNMAAEFDSEGSLGLQGGKWQTRTETYNASGGRNAIVDDVGADFNGDYSRTYWYVGGATRGLIEPSAPDGSPMLYFNPSTHTSGNLVEILNNTTNKFTVDFKGTAGVIHLDGFGSTPTISTNSGSGLGGASATITGSDLSGEITINTGLTPAVNASIVTINFNTAYDAAPYVVLWPSSATSSVVGFLPYVTSTVNGFSVKNPVALGLAGSTTYKYNYVSIQ